jgi:hypothetical protein
LAVGAVAGAALVLPALPARADFPYNDIVAMRFLEEIARLEADFFAKAANSSTADGLQEREVGVLATIARQDAELVRWFRAARGNYGLSAYSTFYTPNLSTSRPLPDYHFGAGTFNTRSGLYSTALLVKETAVGGFHGVVGEADSPKMIQAFAALAGVQGRHLAMLRELAGQNPLVPFEAALSQRVVAQRLDKYGFDREVLG